MNPVAKVAIASLLILPIGEAAARAAALQNLPVKEFATIGPGRNPLLGYQGGL